MESTALKKKFRKKDCGKSMTQGESRKVQLDMLDALAEYCDIHGLRYYLSGGTLLGAIRHQGFIPWDDDIDVNMPRPDIEKLYRMTGGQLKQYVLAEPDRNKFSRCCESYRLYDFNTVIENYAGGTAKKNPLYLPIFIDIFPIEGLPEKKWRTRLHYMRIVFLRKMFRSSSLEHLEGKTIYAHIFHVISVIPAKLIGYSQWSRWIQGVATKYDFETQKYVGVMNTPVHTVNERVLKDEYIPSVEVLFEGKHYHAPKNYDTYLTQLYGNYMEMPPVEKQKSHHIFHMYWRKKRS